MKRKILAFMASVLMIITMMPAMAFAAESAPEYDSDNNVYYANGHDINITPGNDMDSILIKADGSAPVSVNKETVIYMGMKSGNYVSDSSVSVNIMGAQVGTLYTGGADGDTKTHVDVTVDSDEGVNGAVETLNVDNTNTVELWLYDADIKSNNTHGKNTIQGNLNNILKAYCTYTGTSDDWNKKSLLQANGLKETQTAYMAEFIYDTCGGGKIYQNGIEYDKISGIAIEGYSMRDSLSLLGHSDEDINSMFEPTADEGKTFAGWYTDPDYPVGAEFYPDDLTKMQLTSNIVGEELIILMSNSDGEINLYAKWDENKGSTGKIENNTPVDNACSGALSNTSGELKDKVLTDNDIKALEDGKDVYVWIETKDISDIVTSADREKVESKLGNNKLAMYFDLTLWKQIEDAGNKISVTTTNGEVTVTLVVPDEFINSNENFQRIYSMIRVHGDEVDIIPCTFDPATKEISFKTDKFSTYALVYEDKAVADTSPSTGDSSSMIVWVLLCALVVVIGTGTFISRKHEKQ